MVHCLRGALSPGFLAGQRFAYGCTSCSGACSAAYLGRGGWREARSQSRWLPGQGERPPTTRQPGCLSVLLSGLHGKFSSAFFATGPFALPCGNLPSWSPPSSLLPIQFAPTETSPGWEMTIQFLPRLKKDGVPCFSPESQMKSLRSGGTHAPGCLLAALLK